MDNDAKLNVTPDGLGEDNADILAAKRRRTAEGTASVSAGELRARMSTAQSKTPQSTRAVPVRSAVPVAKPTVPAKTAKTALPAATVSPAAQAAKQAAVKKAPTSSAPQVIPAKPKTAVSSRAVPVKHAPTEQKQTAKPADTPKPSVQTGKPTDAPKSTAVQPSDAVKSAVKLPVQTVKPADTPKPKAKPAEKKRASGAMHELIPHQQAALPTDKKQVTEDATRVTDVQALRSAHEQTDATRLSDVSPLVPKRKKERTEDESEGRNAVISVIKAITYIVSVVVVSVFLAVFIILVGNDVYAFVKDDTVIEVTIPEYATLNDVTDALHANGLIEYPNIFKIYSNLNKTKKEKENGFVFVAGTYPVTPMMNYDELLYAFKEKEPTGTSRITIPEGYTTDQIIDLLVSKGIGTREGYIDVINNYEFDYWFVHELEANGWKDGRYYRLDGYLFPDTYEFYNKSSETVVINKMLRRFNQIFVEAFTVRATEMGYTVDEILTIASIVEKEGGTQSDFFNISSVFHNRLKSPAKFPYLESDATVVYAIHHDTGEHINPTKNDLEYESPYNTHKKPGLTPGPIANPSASAIRAALYPADTKYYYFYSASSTVTLFASTLDEHLANVAKGASGASMPPQE